MIVEIGVDETVFEGIDEELERGVVWVKLVTSILYIFSSWLSTSHKKLPSQARPSGLEPGDLKDSLTSKRKTSQGKSDRPVKRNHSGYW